VIAAYKKSGKIFNSVRTDTKTDKLCRSFTEHL
jgi:hypothetical protein